MLGEQGYAAADALVALLILATVIAASLNALVQARRLTQGALEARQARLLVGYLLAQGAERAMPSALAGRSADFDWTLTADEPARTAGAASLCKKSVRLTGRGSGRIYAASTVTICRDLQGWPG